MSTLNIITVAMSPIHADISANIGLMRRHIGEAKKKHPNVDIILFPEMCLTGYVLDETNQALAQPLDGPAVNAIKDIAKEYDVAVVATFIHKNDQGLPFNAVFVVDKTGVLLAHYDKNHLFSASSEPKLYAAGDALGMFELEGWRCGLSICFDIRYPRLFEAYKAKGVECMFSPFNWVQGRNKVNLFNLLIQARAHENQFFMAAVDRAGDDPNASYHGISMIANPFGESVGQTDGVYTYAEINKQDIELLSRTFPLKPGFKDSYNG